MASPLVPLWELLSAASCAWRSSWSLVRVICVSFHVLPLLVCLPGTVSTRSHESLNIGGACYCGDPQLQA